MLASIQQGNKVSQQALCLTYLQHYRYYVGDSDASWSPKVLDTPSDRQMDAAPMMKAPQMSVVDSGDLLVSPTGLTVEVPLCDREQASPSPAGRSGPSSLESI